MKNIKKMEHIWKWGEKGNVTTADKTTCSYVVKDRKCDWLEGMLIYHFESKNRKHTSIKSLKLRKKIHKKC